MVKTQTDRIKNLLFIFIANQFTQLCSKILRQKSFKWRRWKFIFALIKEIRGIFNIQMLHFSPHTADKAKALVGIRTVLLELSALFPYESIAQIALRVTVGIFIISHQPLFVKKNSALHNWNAEKTKLFFYMIIYEWRKNQKNTTNTYKNFNQIFHVPKFS